MAQSMAQSRAVQWPQLTDSMCAIHNGIVTRTEAQSTSQASSGISIVVSISGPQVLGIRHVTAKNGDTYGAIMVRDSFGDAKASKFGVEPNSRALSAINQAEITSPTTKDGL